MPDCARCGKKVAVTMSANRPGGKPTPQLCLPCLRRSGDEIVAALKKDNDKLLAAEKAQP